MPILKYKGLSQIYLPERYIDDNFDILFVEQEFGRALEKLIEFKDDVT